MRQTTAGLAADEALARVDAAVTAQQVGDRAHDHHMREDRGAEQFRRHDRERERSVGGGGENRGEPGAKKDDGNVVDAEYEEVKDKK